MGSEAKEEIIFGLYDFSLLAETQSNAENYFAILCAFARNVRIFKINPWGCSLPVETSPRGVFKENNSCKTIFYKNQSAESSTES